MKPYRFALLLSMSICPIANAADNEWVTAATGADDILWQIRAGSLQFESNREDEPIASVVGRAVDADEISVFKWYVSAEDCSNRSGSLVILNLDGELIGEHDYVEGEESIVSTVASLICKAAIKEIGDDVKQ